MAGGLGVGCTILTRAACNFYRVRYEPDLLNSFEISKLRGHSCKYQISVTNTENNTVSRLLISDSAFTSNGIKISILGAYDQPQLHIQDMLIQRVGRPTEAYLTQASEKNFPKAGTVGAIQANISYTKNFIFDPDLTTCDFFEDNLRCITAPDALENIRHSKESALPLQRDVHLFNVNGDKLQSNLLLSSAVRVQMHFSNFKIAVRMSTICPKFDEKEFTTSGCYDCSVLARLTFTAHSTCQPGVVLVNFQDITVHTKAIQLTTEPQTHVIKFYADKQCYAEKLCLKSPTLIQCHNLNFCLDEPSVELLQLDTNYTRTASAHMHTNFLDLFTIPDLNSSFFILKFIGSVLFIICIFITILSTLITCCCRSR